MKADIRVFELPAHPTKGGQRIVVEKPAPDSVWYLVLDEEKAKPLVKLENPRTAKDVLDSIQDHYGERILMDFVMDGYSRVAKDFGQKGRI